MIKYIDYQSFDFVIEYLCESTNLDFVEVFMDIKKGKTLSEAAGINRLKIEQWSQLSQINQEEDIFGQSHSKPYLVDIETLEIDNKAAKLISQISNDQLIIFISKDKDKLKADEKKVLKSLKIEYLELKKPDTLKLQKILDSRGDQTTDSKKLISIAKDYSEFINILDYLDLVPDAKTEINRLTKSPDPLLFMLGFRLGNLQSDIPKWLKHVEENDIQLGLSLIFGKLQKQGDKKLTKLLIDTDHKIKNNSKASATIFWKLYLWQCLQSEF